MEKARQLIIQFVFLIIFIFLFVIGKVQLWMGLFLLGIITSFLLGRIYCGWICPINTVMIGVTWIKKKMFIKGLKIPQSLTKPWVRFLALGFFIAIFIFTMSTGKKLPVLPALFAIGVLLTFFFPEKLWHHYLCPFGTIMSFSASKARHSINIRAEKCNNCGFCDRVCLANAIDKNDKYHSIIKSNCLVCMECLRKCKQNAISYK